MKVASSVKRRCPKCKIIKRNGVVRVICSDPNHKPVSYTHLDVYKRQVLFTGY